MQNQHYKALRNILFMWAKLNPGIAYVQGMNEVLGPIYYVFATDCDESFKLHAEADAFFCFTQIMSEIMNNFCTTLDQSDMGIKGRMACMNQMLKKKDPVLWKHLVCERKKERKKIAIYFFRNRFSLTHNIIVSVGLHYYYRKSLISLMY